MRQGLVLLFLLPCTLPLPAHATPVGGTQGLVATAHEEATSAGLDMLKAGGTACDAAVAAAFTLAVVEPYSSGIGGGGFVLLRHNKKVTFLDFREVGPALAKADMYMRNGHAEGLLARDGALAVGVPGAVAGYIDLHKRCGKLPLATVMARAIRLAQEGYGADLRYNNITHGRLSVLRQDPEAARIFLMPSADGPPVTPTVGHRIVQPELAATLRSIAADAGKDFYTGSIAERISADIRRRGGIMSKEDFASYSVRERTPLVGSYRGQAIATAPPPSSGGTILLIVLNVMETLAPSTPWHDPAWLRLFIEACNHAYADRTLLGDPKSLDYLATLLPQLISKSRAASLSHIPDRATPASAVLPGQGTVMSSAVPPPPGPEGEHTTHLSVVDASGDAVAMTTTVNFAWGAAVVATGTGVLLNDEMDDFATAVGVPNSYRIVGAAANAVGAGKVPLSSMSPTFVFAGPNMDTPLRLVVGSPGGSRIPTTVAQIIMNYIDHGADVRWAVTLPRIHHQHLPDVVEVEPFGLEPTSQALLKSLGYALKEDENHWCNATVISLDPSNGLRAGAADPRGVGTAQAQ